MRSALTKMSVKQKVIIFAVGLVVIASGLIGYVEYSASRHVDETNARYQQAKRDVYQQLSSEELTSQLLVDLKTKIEQVADGLCDPSVIVDWRISQDERVACAEHQDRLMGVSRQIDRLTKQLELSESMSTMLSAAAKDLDQTEKGDYLARQKVWGQTFDAITEVTEASVSQADQLIQLKSDIKQVIARYDKLIVADKAKQRSQFDDAAAQLQEAYDKLYKSKSKLEQPYRDQTDTLLDSVEVLLAT